MSRVTRTVRFRRRRNGVKATARGIRSERRTVYAASGGIVGRACINNQETARLGIKAASGRYLAMINGITKQSLIITIHN